MSIDLTDIPKRDHREFLELPPELQRETLRWIIRINLIEASDQILETVSKISVSSGLTRSSIYRHRRHYHLYGWRGLINRAKYPRNLPETSGKPFRRFIHGLWLANGQNYKAAYSHLITLWHAGAEIPGVTRVPRYPGDDAPKPPPAGWGYYNIRYQILQYAKDQRARRLADSISTGG